MPPSFFKSFWMHNTCLGRLAKSSSGRIDIQTTNTTEKDWFFQLVSVGSISALSTSSAYLAAVNIGHNHKIVNKWWFIKRSGQHSIQNRGDVCIYWRVYIQQGSYRDVDMQPTLDTDARRNYCVQCYQPKLNRFLHIRGLNSEIWGHRWIWLSLPGIVLFPAVPFQMQERVGKACSANDPCSHLLFLLLWCAWESITPFHWSQWKQIKELLPNDHNLSAGLLKIRMWSSCFPGFLGRMDVG